MFTVQIVVFLAFVLIAFASYKTFIHFMRKEANGTEPLFVSKVVAFVAATSVPNMLVSVGKFFLFLMVTF